MRMNINVYLPDELGEKVRAQEAKGEKLPLSQLLQEAVREELNRRESMAVTLQDPSEYEVALEDDEGRPYTGRITGSLIAEDRDLTVYLTNDERVILYDPSRAAYWEIEDPEEELRSLERGAYAAACAALGITPVIDL